MSNLVQRSLSGAVYVAVVVASILVHPAFFGGVFLIVSMLATREYMQLRGADTFLRGAATMCTGLLFALTWWALFGNGEADWLLPVLILVYILTLGGTLISELFRQAIDPVRNWGDMLVSQMMIAVPFALMNGILSAGNWLLLSLFILIWLNDSGAYCVGSLMSKRKGGNHKMFPRVSPNKSWEGLVGGAIVAVGAAFLLAHFGCLHALPMPFMPWVSTLLFGLTVVVFGTLGDLMESLLKRTIGVKDSGRFMPGHGGVLDRFDSILLATPAVVLLILILMLF